MKKYIRDFFEDYPHKITKLNNLFRQVYQKSTTLFEDVTSVKILPYCISTETNTNYEICFRNTKIHNLDNLKLASIELGKSMIHKTKINRFLHANHKFDELLISGTTNFVDVDSEDEYNTSLFNGHLVIYRDYKYPGFFSLEIPSLESYSETNTDKYVAHAVDMHLKSSDHMFFYLPVKGLNGLLNQLENEINTLTVSFPDNITFGCKKFPKIDETKIPEISIDTINMRLMHHNYDVFNNVKFVDKGSSYYTQFFTTFNKLVFISNMSVKINGILHMNEDVVIEINKLHIEIMYRPFRVPMYEIRVVIMSGLSLSAEKPIDPYFYTPNFKEKLASCIRSTTIYNLLATLNVV